MLTDMFADHWSLSKPRRQRQRQRHETEGLRRNPPEERVTTGQTLCIKITCIILQTSV